jgi:serine/threonine protein kinase/WD40 repeat protein
MRDCPAGEQLQLLLAGRLSAGEEDALSAHIETCPRCRSALEALVGEASGEAIPLRAPEPGHEKSFAKWLQGHLPSQAGSGTSFGALILPGPSPHDTARSAQPAPAEGQRRAPLIPGYEVLEVLGRGGMGVVYLARQVALNRVVALKMILHGAHAGADDLARFRREAEAVARVQHPNIVQVYDSGEHEGRPYLALEFVKGGSLKEFLKGVPQPASDAARLVEVLARAVDAAHRQGIVHRDLKPANILLQRKTTTNYTDHTDKKRPGGSSSAASVSSVASVVDFLPKITDFGLAKLVSGEEGSFSSTDPTRTGDVIGTPGYMAPEQALPSRQPVGPWTDVYGLGAILYEMLAGRAPFTGGTPMEVLLRMASQDPPPLSRLQPRLPPDLCTICQRCLEKEPGKRYASAAELADDLHRFLHGEPITARPVGEMERLWKWARRRPALAALLALLVLVSLAGLVLVSWQWYEADQARRQAQAKAADEAVARRQADVQRREAERERRRAQRLSAELALDQGSRLCQEGKMAPGLLWLARALELTPADEPDLDYTIRANLAAWQGHFCPVRVGPAPGTPVPAVAFSPDGKTILTGDWGNHWGKPGPAHAQLWQAATWKPLLKEPVKHQAAIWSVAFAPDGKAFATGSFDGSARLWDTATGRPRSPPLPHEGRVFGVAFSPDGKTLATVSLWLQRPLLDRVLGAEVRLWDAASGKLQWQARLRRVLLKALAWSPDGKVLAAGGLVGVREESAVGGVALLLDLRGQKVRRELLHPEAVNGVAFQPGGKLLATASEDGLVRFWEPQTGRRRPLVLRHPQPVTSLAFSADGRSLVSGCGSGAGWVAPGDARLWDVATGQLLVQPLVPNQPGFAPKVHTVALGPDGRTVVTGSEHGRTCLWTVGGANTPLAILRPGAAVPESGGPEIAFSPDGHLLLVNRRLRPGRGQPTGAGWSEVALYTPSAAATGVVLRLPVAVDARFSPDGSRILTWSRPVNPRRRRTAAVLRLWQAGTGREVDLPTALLRELSCAAFSPDGKTLLSGHTDGRARLFDGLTLAPRGQPLFHGARIDLVAFAPDGQRLLTVGGDDRARLWHTAGGQPAGTADWVRGYGLGTGRILVSVREHSAAGGGLWEGDGRLVGTGAEPAEVATRALHPSGRSFLPNTQDWAGNIGPAALQEVGGGQALGPALPWQVQSAAFDPPGRLLAVGDHTRHAHLWSVALHRPVGPPLLHPGRIDAVAFHPGGRLLASSGADGTVRLWRVPAPAAGEPAQVRRTIEALTASKLDVP